MTRASGQKAVQEPQAVAGQPRLFVGQVPTTLQEKDLLPIFGKYGDVETIQVVKGPDQKSRGCAMVQFRKWSAAESAMEGLNGSTILEGNKSRALVVNFANPRRGSIMSTPGETAIAPRKLSVVGLSHDCTEDQVLEVFSVHGEVESINLTQESALIQYKKWAGCENALDMLHNKHTMPGCDSPLQLKFVEVSLATPSSRNRGGSNDSSSSPAYTIPSSPNVPQGSSDSTQSHAYNHHHHHQRGNSFGNGYTSNSYGYNNKRNNNNNNNNNNGNTGMHYAMQGAAQQQYHHPQHTGMIQYIGHPAELAHHMMQQHGQQQAYLHHHHHATAAMGIPLSGLPGVPGLLHNSNGGLSHGGGRGRIRGKATAGTGSSVGAQSSRRGGMGSSVTNGSSDSLANTSDGSDVGHYTSAAANNAAGSVNGLPFNPQHHHQMISLHEMNNAMHHQYMHAMPAAPYMGYPMMHQQTGPLLGPGKKIGRGVVDPTVYAHKLFVGQVPFEATEQDLWHMFAPFGDILELAVLRSGGMSKGCAFLTYATKQQALHATSALHGHLVGAAKRLVVKFADHKVNNASAEDKME